jgi:ArsR family transcriptional regulator, arsenate/arsenite/antimonite-responsive transcriptional repressor
MTAESVARSYHPGMTKSGLPRRFRLRSLSYGGQVASRNDSHTKGNSVDRPLYIHNSGCMESEDAILALAALAQPTRLDVFKLLVKHEPDGLAAGDIARALAVPQNTMSSHLSVLSRAGLVSAQRFSRSIVYRADLTRLQAVVLFMLRDCCDGRPEICAPLIESLAPCCPPKPRRKAHV